MADELAEIEKQILKEKVKIKELELNELKKKRQNIEASQRKREEKELDDRMFQSLDEEDYIRWANEQKENRKEVESTYRDYY